MIKQNIIACKTHINSIFLKDLLNLCALFHFVSSKFLTQLNVALLLGNFEKRRAAVCCQIRQ